MMMEMTISPEQFGKDHWSTLAFVETRCVDDNGVLDKDRMRCNLNRHRGLAGKTQQGSGLMDWKMNWCTCLKDGTPLPEHDDWDCLIDLAKAGYVEIIDIDAGTVRLTEQGWTIAHQLRRFIAQKGSYKAFRIG